MPLFEPFKYVPRDIREWSQWFSTLQVIPDDDSVSEIKLEDDSVTTPKIVDDAVTLAKMAEMATNSFLGRDTAGVGNPEVLSAVIARLVLDTSNRVTVTTTSHTAATERIILVDDDTAGSTVTVDLPAGVDGFDYHVKKLGSTAKVIVDANGAELIDSMATVELTMQYDSVHIIHDGSNWNIV